MLVPVRASPVPSVVRGSFVVKFFISREFCCKILYISNQREFFSLNSLFPTAAPASRSTPTTLQHLKAHRLALRLLSGEVRHNLANRATRRPRPTRGAASAASGRTTLPSAGGSKRTASGRQTRKFPPDWQRRRKHGGENTASPPGTVSLRKKLNRCAQARNVKGALALFASEAESGGVVPDTRSYNVLLGMLVERPDEWWRVRRHMAAAGLPPDEATISLEVRALVNTGDLDAAAETVAAAAARGMPARRRTFASLLEALCGAGRLAAAARISGQSRGISA